jgi:hypothetical protein
MIATRSYLLKRQRPPYMICKTSIREWLSGMLLICGRRRLKRTLTGQKILSRCMRLTGSQGTVLGWQFASALSSLHGEDIHFSVVTGRR